MQFANREQTEAEVLREAGCATTCRQVAHFAVARNSMIQKLPHSRARRFFSSLQNSFGSGRQLPKCVLRNRQGMNSRRRGEGFDTGRDGWLGQFLPRFGIRREHAKGIARAGQNLTPLVNGYILERHDGNAKLLPHFFQLLFDGAPVRIRVAIKKNRLGLGLDSKFLQLSQSITLAKNQSTADGLKIGIQRTQRPTKEVLAVRTGPAMVFFPVAQNVNGNDLRTRY